MKRMIAHLSAAAVTAIGLTFASASAGAAEKNIVDTAVAAVVSLVPEGLMVLASLTYAVAALLFTH